MSYSSSGALLSTKGKLAASEYISRLNSLVRCVYLMNVEMLLDNY